MAVIIFGDLLIVAPLILIWQICSSSKLVANGLNFNFGRDLIYLKIANSSKLNPRQYFRLYSEKRIL